jgi:hypothetical protein
VAISRVGGAAGGTSATLPAHQVGDFIIGISFRDGNNTAPTIPAGVNWVPFDTTAGTASNGSGVAYKFATSTSETTGTWSSATSVGFVIYRGVDPTTPISISYASDANFTGTSTITWNGFTFAVTDGTSWALGFAGHRQVNNDLAGNPPSGMTNIAAASVIDGTDDFAIHDTNGGVTGWSNTNVVLAGTNGGVRTRVIEIRAAGAAATVSPGRMMMGMGS